MLNRRSLLGGMLAGAATLPFAVRAEAQPYGPPPDAALITARRAVDRTARLRHRRPARNAGRGRRRVRN